MIAVAITCLFAVVGLATLLSLLDTWTQARTAFWSVYREKQLLDAGFVPQVAAEETRLRQPLHRAVRRVPAGQVSAGQASASRASAGRARKSGFGGSRRSTLGSLQAIG